MAWHLGASGLEYLGLYMNEPLGFYLDLIFQGFDYLDMVDVMQSFNKIT